jgi:hypothetical protein
MSAETIINIKEDIIVPAILPSPSIYSRTGPAICQSPKRMDEMIMAILVYIFGFVFLLV